jgi:TonB family protein
MRAGGFAGRWREGSLWGAVIGPIVLAGTLAAQASSWTPPKLVDAQVPATPTGAVGGGQVLLDVAVGETGSVTGMAVLRQTPPFTEAAQAAVQGWRFEPARAKVRPKAGEPVPDEPQPVPSRVLVAVVYRAPALMGPTLGQVPADTGTPSDDIVFPTSVVTPVYPPAARMAGTVLVQVKVDERGRVVEATVQRSAPGFDSAALEAARAWTFRAARVDGAPQATVAFLVFAFQQPITAAAVQ